jgi:thymidylate synthase (FAD)
MKIKLIQHHPECVEVVAFAAKMCTGTISEYGSPEFNEWFMERGHAIIKNCIRNGHESIIEHASFTFVVTEISRACSHQFVRHRIASYSQRSQRYCKEHEFEAVVPDGISNHKGALDAYSKAIDIVRNLYQNLIDSGIKPEDARYILPNSCHTELVFTANARALRNFFKLRLDNHAQWEIRRMAREMLKQLDDHGCGIFFDDIIDQYPIQY